MRQTLFAFIAGPALATGISWPVRTPDIAQPLPRRASKLSAHEILSGSIAAMGGEQALKALEGVTYSAYLFRSQTLMESVTPGYADNTVATTGLQNISYDLTGSLTEPRRRDDRFYSLSEYWYFGKATLPEQNVSLVTTSDYACYVIGNEGIYQPPEQKGGYQDASLTRVLNRDALRLSPKLLLMMQNSSQLSADPVTVRGVEFSAVTDHVHNLTVIFDPSNNLPYLVRAYEDHHIFGPSTNDLVLYNYTEVGGLRFPRRIKIMYNERHMLFDSLVGTIAINPSFSANFFDGLSPSEIASTELQLPPTAPEANTDYGDAEVVEFSSNLLWYGGYYGKLTNITVTNPIPELPRLHHLVFNDAPAYAQTIGEFDDGVMVVDAPPHQSKLVIEWVQETLKKNVTHLLVSHHHHDHNYGAADYVAAGAKLVVPEPFTSYWSKIPGVKFETVREGEPFIHKDGNLQVRAVWHQQQVHANDWMYFTWTPSCPKNGDPMAVTVADPWSPGLVGYEFNQFAAIEYLDIVRDDGMVRENVVFPLHGVPTNVTELYEQTGYTYPPLKMSDFKPGGAWC